MKSKVSEGKCEQEIKYPCLRESKMCKNKVILFENDRSGVCVSKGNGSFNVGQWHSFNVKDYKPFTGSVCLEN